ncbi:unnamed protein product, partial [Allacma fusca]
ELRPRTQFEYKSSSEGLIGLSVISFPLEIDSKLACTCLVAGPSSPNCPSRPLEGESLHECQGRMLGYLGIDSIVDLILSRNCLELDTQLQILKPP